MASSRSGAAPGKGGGTIWNNPTFRAVLFQAAFVLAFGWLAYAVIENTVHNLSKAHIATGYRFLNHSAGFGIIQKLIPYTEADTFGRAVVVGLLNTLLVSALGVVLASAIGFVVGIARLSSNWLISTIAATYVEVLRNVPLLLQLFFWYFAVLRAVPGMRERWTFLGVFHLNIAGLHAPRPVFGEGSLAVLIALAVAVALAMLFTGWNRRRFEATGRSLPAGWLSAALIVLLPVAVFFVAGRPIGFDLPVFNETGPLLRRGFQADNGLTILPELIGLTLALSLYTATYIAEIVRSGIQAVGHGQTEAAYSLGLSGGQTLRLVVIPQAMRVIIPPLTNQYLNLTKNSSLAVAVAYPDLVSVGGTVLSQTGQAVEMVSIWMAFYLGLSLLTSFVMNIFNRRAALVER